MRRRVGLVVVALATIAACAGPPATQHIATGTVPSETVAPSTTTTEAPTTTTAAPVTTAKPAAPRPATTSKPRTVTTKAPAAPVANGAGITAAFYYGWYRKDVGFPQTHYHPAYGPYDARDLDTVKRQIAQMRYAGMQAAIASWWGPGHNTDEAFAVGLTAAEGTPFKWSIYYEPEGPGFPNLTVDQLRVSLQYVYDHYANHPNFLHLDGRPVIFVWPDPNDRCEMVTRWAAANTMGFHVVQKRFPGYESCQGVPNSWHDYSPDHYKIEVKPWSISVGPGFWRYDEASPRLARDPAQFESAVRALAGSSAMWKLLTTFNEFNEGTAVEPATEWASASGYGTYIDILHAVLGSR
jgi:hypothetical protein